MRSVLIFAAITLFVFAGYGQGDSLAAKGETRLKNIKQLTFGGENAEAYWSNDGKQLVFQSKREGRGCDQIYTMNADGGNVKMIFLPSGETVASAS
jgi:Tol biopolymer transport system component